VQASGRNYQVSEDISGYFLCREQARFLVFVVVGIGKFCFTVLTAFSMQLNKRTKYKI
jgi:hypothetical protein